MYRVKCTEHNYDTFFTIDSQGIAIAAARMHSMLPCDKVEVTDAQGNKVEWREKAA